MRRSASRHPTVQRDILSLVGHEVRTPVTSIQMVIHLLLEQNVGALTPQQKELLQTAREETERLLKLLDHFLVLAKFDHGKVVLELTECDPLMLCADAVEQVCFQLGSDRVIDMDADGAGPVRCDPALLVQVLTNFLGNAIKHTGETGEIELRVRTLENGVTRFSVWNNGPGVPEEHQERIFERFVQVPGTSQEGTGLGLAIAREIIALHGGEIGCEGVAGDGCEFFFTLPPPS